MLAELIELGEECGKREREKEVSLLVEQSHFSSFRLATTLAELLNV